MHFSTYRVPNYTCHASAARDPPTSPWDYVGYLL